MSMSDNLLSCKFNIAVEDHNFSWENPLSMAIFHSYVKLPDGNLCETFQEHV